uniref:Alpha-amylase n=1 Tax=Ips typographus TaxID=55986 RepID=E7DYB2_IPSTY|nr:amylase B isoform 2 [Ips typographus]
MKWILAAALCISVVVAQHDPHFEDGRNTIVHLFEWKWSDIADECENFLSKKAYAGVQISPPSENPKVEGRPWWEKYQPISYVLENRSGNEAALADMIRRCNNVGIRIYADLVVNHMATSTGEGTAGDTFDPDTKSYPAVPYSSENFHPSCDIDYSDASSIRNCELVALKDLDQSQEYVRGKIIDYINHLISLGVAGFRVDAAKHMWPEDLSVIFSRVNELNTEYFPSGSKPLFYQEVIDTGSDPVYNTDYVGSCTNGWVCQHRWSPIFNMVEFRSVVSGTELTNWWVGGDNQIAFSRGDKGMIAITVEGEINADIETSLPDGIYCDVISGSLVDGHCTGKTVNVSGGKAHIEVSTEESECVVAVHVNAKL